MSKPEFGKDGSCLGNTLLRPVSAEMAAIPALSKFKHLVPSPHHRNREMDNQVLAAHAAVRHDQLNLLALSAQGRRDDAGLTDKA